MSAEPAAEVRVSTHAMGSEFALLLLGEERDLLLEAGGAALAEIEAAEAQLSHTVPGSELWEVNERAGHEPVPATPSFLALLERARRLSEQTERAFDITVGALLRCWGFYRGSGRMPSPAEVDEARAACGWEHVCLDGGARTVRFTREGVALHFGAIGKGYALDRAAEVLRDHGVAAALLHGGGSSVLALGAPPGEVGWRVGVRDPEEAGRRLGTVVLRDASLSTSEPGAQSFVHEGRRRGHILDPRAGWPAEGILSATAIAATGTESDALATALVVAGTGERRGAEAAAAGEGKRRAAEGVEDSERRNETSVPRPPLRQCVGCSPGHVGVGAVLLEEAGGPEGARELLVFGGSAGAPEWRWEAEGHE